MSGYVDTMRVASNLVRSLGDETGGGLTLFDSFEEFDIATTGTTIHGRRSGEGPPILLLHGIPETHLMWHRVAPQ
jgi:pimeloyl-ACP methyl ester carboxylesterase